MPARLAGPRPARTTLAARPPAPTAPADGPPAPASDEDPQPHRGRHRAPAPPVPRFVRAFWVRLVPPLLLLLGLQIRVFQWYGERSLWLDEALIARSLVSRGYVELVAEPLQGDQAAPVLWLWATRLSIDLFGQGERPLRLVSLLAGIAIMGLSWLLARRLLPPVLVPLALALVVLSPSLIYFSNEVKPYSLDVAVVLALLLLALRVPRGGGARHVRLLALAGAAAVWASFASVFVLAGLSVVLVLGALRGRGGRVAALRRATGVALTLSLWGVSLGISYVTILYRLRDSEVLSGFWGYTFPDRAADLPTWLLRRAIDLTRDPLELALWPVALALLGFGAYRMARFADRRWLLATAGVPVALVAAGLSAYPFASRLALWLVPLGAVALVAVLPATLERAWAVMAGAAALTLVAAPAAATGLAQTNSLRLVEELRPVMNQVAATKRPDDLVLVDIPAKAPFDFYTPSTGLGRDGVILFATTEEVGGVCNDPIALKTARFERQRVWVVFAHALSDPARLGTRADMIARIEDVTQRSTTIEDYGAKAILFDPDAPASAASDEPRNDDRCLAVVRTVPRTG